jgi:hypothetical protein
MPFLGKAAEITHFCLGKKEMLCCFAWIALGLLVFIFFIAICLVIFYIQFSRP